LTGKGQIGYGKEMVGRKRQRIVGATLGLCVTWLLVSAAYTKADVYVYRDDRGIVHFTNVPTKPVYRPFLILQHYARTLRGRETAQFDRLIAAACARYMVEFALVKAVIKAESAFDPLALSSAGARGLMQLMPETAALHGVENSHDPRSNIEGGVRHLRLLLNRFRGNLPLTLAAYNAGAETVERYKGVPPYEETQTYIQRVLQYRDSYRQRSAESPRLGKAAPFS
jgi:soluble lytic murein transglycosylase-like protein